MENIVVMSSSQLEQTISRAIHQAVSSLPPPPEPNTNNRLTISQVCEKYNISRPTCHKLMKLGLRYEKIGRRTLFRAETVEAYFRSKSK